MATRGAGRGRAARGRGRGVSPPGFPGSPVVGRGGRAPGGSPKGAGGAGAGAGRSEDASGSRNYDTACCGPPRCDPYLPCTEDKVRFAYFN